MNFRQVEAFRALMIAGTASRAAEMLRISQPAVSRHIAEFEAAARLELFERVKGRLKPTAEANALFEEVQRAFTGLERLRFAAENIRSFTGARLRVVGLPALGHAFLPRVIGDFAKAFPDASVLLQVRSSEYVREEVATGNFDLGFAADEISQAGVVVQAFSSAPAVCILPSDHHLAHFAGITPEMLDGVRFVTLASEDAARARFDRLFAEAGVQPLIVGETQYSLTVCNLVRHRVGIGLVNPFSLDGMDLSGLVIRPFTPAIQFRSLLLRPPNAPTSRLIDAFVGFAIEARNQLEKSAEKSIDG
tara:strand:- start:503 stop:1417 length:915 start_codon:yes stop_codon:yes gene_type:complete